MWVGTAEIIMSFETVLVRAASTMHAHCSKYVHQQSVRTSTVQRGCDATRRHERLFIKETHDLIHARLNMTSETRSDHCCLGKARPYSTQTSPDVSSDSEASLSPDTLSPLARRRRPRHQSQYMKAATAVYQLSLPQRCVSHDAASELPKSRG